MGLEAVEVFHRYGTGEDWVLSDFSITIPRGSITALVGPNGAGKSTLLRAWAGFEQPSSGHVAVLGHDLRADPRAYARVVGYFPQGVGLYRGLTIAQHVDLAEELRTGFDRDAAVERLTTLRLPMGRRAGRLSGGQQAQVVLALVLGTRAPVWLFDEPLAALDPLARRDFLAVLVDGARAAGATVVLTSHVISDVEAACDSVAVMGDGQLLLHDTIEQAIATHRVSSRRVPGATVGELDAPGADHRLFLVRSGASDLRPPSLDQLVIGYLMSLHSAGRGVSH